MSKKEEIRDQDLYDYNFITVQVILDKDFTNKHLREYGIECIDNHDEVKTFRGEYDNMVRFIDDFTDDEVDPEGTIAICRL